MANLRSYTDVPGDVRNFLSYLSNIKGKSDNTINEYYYDLRTFFRFMKCHRLMSSFEEFDNIDCSDIKTDFIRDILLDDLYEYLMYANSGNMARIYSKISDWRCSYGIQSVPSKKK